MRYNYSINKFRKKFGKYIQSTYRLNNIYLKEVGNSMAKLLFVEDSAEIREIVTDYFTEKGKDIMEIDIACDGNKGIELAGSNTYDLALIDIMLPGASGFAVCKALRAKSDCPIIFLTALGTEDNILKGYEAGCDEYVTKPFSLKVLYAKCLAHLKRSGGPDDLRVLSAGEIKMYPSKMQVFVNGEEIFPAPKEYFLLKVLIENKGYVLSRQKLLDMVWGVGHDGNDRAVDTHIKKLRKMLGSEGSRIKTVIGGGYKIT